MYFVGIDISKFKHDCAIIDELGDVITPSWSFQNDCEGLSLLRELLDALDGEKKIGLEATGHYGQNLKLFFENNGFSFMEFNPLLINRFVRSKSLRKTKTDSIDALMIAQYLMTVEYKPYPPSFYTLEKLIMAAQVKKLYELGIVDASFIGLDSTPVAANTKQNNPKSFTKDKFNPEKQPKADPDCALGVHSASNQHNERRYEFYWGYKNHVLVDCISGLPLYELTTPGNIADSSVAAEILAEADRVISLKECTFLADKGYDVKSIYNTVKTVYEGEAFIPLNPRSTKVSKTLLAGNPVCEAGLAMHKDGKTIDNGRTRQKYCCPFRQSKSGVCPCNHKNWNNGKKNRGCTKYKTVPNDYRLSIDRSCLYFKRTYALRTECERYNSRFKASGQERLWVRNGSSATNLNTVAHISALAVALTTVLHGSHSYRSAKQLRRSA